MAQKATGKALDSPAINKAIDAAAAAGGGTVLFTAGTYRSFSIRLKSNVALYLDQGATILAANPRDDEFFIRHVKGLQMRDVEVSYLSPDLRPAAWKGERLFRQDFRIYRMNRINHVNHENPVILSNPR